MYISNVPKRAKRGFQASRVQENCKQFLNFTSLSN